MRQLFTLVIFILIAQTGFSQTWVKKADFTGPGRSRNGCFSIGDTCYVIAGGSNTQGYLRDCYAYDTASNSWWQIAGYPGQGSDGVVGFAINGIGYAGTGAVGGYQYFNDFWKYTPGNNTWVQIPSFPGQGRSFDVSFTIGGKGYVGGGVNGYNNNALPDFFAYDPIANHWDSVATCPASGVVQSGAFAVGNKGYFGTGFVLSGGGYTYTPTQEFWEYDPYNGHLGTWTRKADFPGAARGLTAGLGTCDKGYMGCGYSNITNSPHYNDFYEYNPVTDKWTKIGDFAGSIRCGVSTYVVGNSLFVGIGANYTTNANPLDFYEYHAVYIPAFSALNTVCTGQQVTFTDTSNFSATSWQWSFPGGKPNTSSIQSPVVEYDTAGTFDVIFTASNGCDGGVKTFTQYITVNQGGVLNATANPTTVCSGQTSTLTVTGGSAYTWSPVNTLNDSTGSTVLANPISTTTYTVKTNGGGGCSSIGQVVVQVANTSVAGTINALRDTLCSGTTGILNLTGNSSNTIDWQSSATATNFQDVGVNDTVNYRTTPLTGTTYYRVIVGNGNCSDTSLVFALIVPPALTANFGYTKSGGIVTFNSDSSLGNIVAYSWDFGDGQHSILKNPVHTYANTDSNYNACLTIYDGSNCSYTFCKDVILKATGVAGIIGQTQWIIYPNPVSDYLFISGIGMFAGYIEIYDVLGRKVITENLTNNNLIKIDVSGLAKGLYCLKLKAGGVDYLQKIVKQ